MIARVAVFAPVERTRSTIACRRRSPRSASARACGRRSAGARSRASWWRSIRPTPSADAKPLVARGRRAAGRRRPGGAGGVGGRVLLRAARRGHAPDAAGRRRGAGASATLALTDEGQRAADGPVGGARADGAARARRRGARAARRHLAAGQRRKGEPAPQALRALVERGLVHDRGGGVDARRAHRDDRALAAPLDAAARAAGVRARASSAARSTTASPRRARSRSRRCAQADARAGEHVRALVEAGPGDRRDARAGRRSVRRRAHRARRRRRR